MPKRKCSSSSRAAANFATASSVTRCERDVIACPTGGPETAHQIINTGGVELRYLAVSTLAPIEICEYPDSGKFGVYEDLPGNGEGRHRRLRHLARHEDARDYWEGE